MANKYKKIKINSSNGLVLRNGPNVLGDIVGKVYNETEYNVLEIVQDRHYLWGKLQENGGWILLENLMTGDINIVEVNPPKKARKTREKTPVAAEKPPDPQEETITQETHFEATEIADE